MYRYRIVPFILSIVMQFSISPAKEESTLFPLNLAVEYTDHAASAYIAQNKGWFKEEGLNPTIYSYVTGMSLASALGRGDIQVAYICLLPAINAYANAKVSIKIVCGTHKHGYGLAVDTQKVKTVKDLEKPEIRIGSNQVAGPADAIIYRTIEKYGLDRDAVLKKIQRMNPAKGVMAIRMGKLDAFFNCEHWPTMAEEAGFKILLTSQDVWPQMQGSVLVVKEELLKNHPDIVAKLVKITDRSIRWIRENPQDAASIMAKQLQITGERNSPSDIPEGAEKLTISPEAILRSMGRIEHSIAIDPGQIQKTIDFAKEQNYIREGFKAGDILDLRFLDDKKK